jgi:hypothetical protein
MRGRDRAHGPKRQTSRLTDCSATAIVRHQAASIRQSARAILRQPARTRGEGHRQRMPKPTISEYTRGALYGLAAVRIWAGFIVVSRLGVLTSLTPWDIAAIRFAVAGSLLLPYAMRKGLALERLGLLGVAAIVIGCGAPTRVSPPS